jgi:dUTPase
MRGFGALIGCVSLMTLPVSAQEPTLGPVLARAGAYIVAFQRELSGVVAEEQYVQDVRYPLSTGNRFNLRALTHRELKSDLLMVKPIGGDRWMQFRDVFDVDGKPVRDRNERLMQLFVSPSASSATQAQRILEESTRYNIGNLQRTVNLPVFALLILDPENQPRFVFKRADRADPALGQRSARLPDDLMVIEYQEVQKQTMIRTTNGRDLPARGRFWIEPVSGRVIASELVAEDLMLKGTIDVDYQLEPTIGLLVPNTMRERYEIRRDGSRVEGEASYSHFRQFQVKVDEKLTPVVKP